MKTVFKAHFLVAEFVKKRNCFSERKAQCPQGPLRRYYYQPALQIRKLSLREIKLLIQITQPLSGIPGVGTVCLMSSSS